MKAKLLIIAFVVLAAAAGYSIASYLTARSCDQIMDGQIRTEVKSRAEVNLKLLNYLHDGKQSEATDQLERQLDVALIQHAGYLNTPMQGQVDVLDFRIFRDVRDYRSRHPWTNDKPDIAEGVRKALELAD